MITGQKAVIVKICREEDGIGVTIVTIICVLSQRLCNHRCTGVIRLIKSF